MVYFPIKGLIYEMMPMSHNQGIQGDGRRIACSEIELNSVECLEAYGIFRGMTKCAQYLEDLRECRYQRYRTMRFHAMERERYRQLLSGERTLKDMKGPAYGYDAYFTDVFTP